MEGKEKKKKERKGIFSNTLISSTKSLLASWGRCQEYIHDPFPPSPRHTKSLASNPRETIHWRRGITQKNHLPIPTFCNACTCTLRVWSYTLKPGKGQGTGLGEWGGGREVGVFKRVCSHSQTRIYHSSIHAQKIKENKTKRKEKKVKKRANSTRDWVLRHMGGGQPLGWAARSKACFTSLLPPSDHFLIFLLSVFFQDD